MEKKNLILCDSDVLIEFLDRSNPHVKNTLLHIGFQNLCASTVTAAELVVGAQDKQHLSRIRHFISDLVVIPVSNDISAILLDLIYKYSLSHGLRIQDACIAATALHFDMPLYTLNKRDFQFINGLRILP